jgi:hypothetical protein
MMSHSINPLRAALCAMVIPATAMSIVPAVADGAHPHESARIARVLSATDTARLRYIKASGSLLLEEGRATGTLPGTMRVRLNVGPTLSGSFTITTRFGSIKGRGSATPHGSGTVESFAGTLVASGGTGRYAHARGHAGLYGTFNRDTYALTVQTTGKLSY